MAELLHADNITKEFPGVKALDSVNIKINGGEVLGLLGENGAGKSTLLNVMSGIFQPDGGKIYMENKEAVVEGPKHAMELGIAIVHQELKLMSNMTVAENIFMGRLPKTKFGKVSYRKLFEDTKALLDRFGFHINPKDEVRLLSIASQQIVEIAKALSVNAKVILMDEPTSSLTTEETERLFSIIEKLKDNGVGIVFISHKLEEIFRCCDHVQVLRDGQDMGVYQVKGITEEKLVELMVGREISQRFPKKHANIGERILEVKNVSRGEYVRNVSFEVHKGEVFGIAGLVGSGRSELVRLVFGADKKDSGEVWIKGKKVDVKSPSTAIENAIFLVPEDRKTQGLILKQTIEKNISLPMIKRIKKLFGFLDAKIEKSMAESEIKSLRIKCTGRSQQVLNLSGGNQQKVVLGKCLQTQPDIMILDDPTRGIDVGTKAEIYEMINDFTQQGKAVILISSELPEVISMSDRVGIMFEGEMKAILSKEDLSQEQVIKYAIGGN